MFRLTGRKPLMVAALAAVCLMLSSSSALAGCGHWRAVHGGWHGYGYGAGYGYGYGYGYGWGCGSGYYSGCAGTASYGSPWATGCGWGCNSCWNSSWSAGYAPYYDSWNSPGYWNYGSASSCCGTAAVARRTVVAQQAPAEALKPTASYRPTQDGVLLTIDVPQDARVYVNGTLTKTAGTHRQYACSGLLPGNSYTYQVRAIVTRNGKELSDTQVVRFRAGETRDLAFDLGGRPPAVIAARLR